MLWQSKIVGHDRVNPNDLTPHPLNFRTHAKQRAALVAAIEEVGFIRSVTINRLSGKILDGHARVAEAIAANVPYIDVEYVELTPDEERVALATLDHLSTLAEVDPAKLDELLADIEFASAELTEMLAELATEQPREIVEDEAPEPPTDPITQPGDLWLLGEHRLLCGDSTKAEDVARVMGSEIADAMWTDPPYGVSYVGKTKDALTIQNDGAADLPQLLHDVFQNADTVLQIGAPIYIARPPGALSVSFGIAFLAAGWHFHQELQWVKDSMVLGHSDYQLKHETVIYGWKPGAQRPWYAGRSEVSVFEVARPKASPDHPTGKPVGLVSAQLRNSTKVGSLVYEPFCGSGTTLIAAEQLNRRCYGIEISPAYCDVIVARWEKLTGRKAERERG